MCVRAHTHTHTLHANRKGNIADHLLGLMEKYAFNLEDTIEEQTLCLALEKERTETLLYRLLPRWVGLGQGP